MKKILQALALVFVALIAPRAALAVDIEEVIGPKTGVKAWLVEDHKLPIVALHLAFQGGGEQDPENRQGLASLTMNALTEGAGDLNAAAFQQRLANRSISMGFSAQRDQLSGGMKCLSADKDEAFELLHMALTSPRFDTADIERLRGQHLSAVKMQFSDPNWQARYALFQQIFSKHPYNQRIYGTTQTLAAITRDDIKAFAAAHMALNTVTVAVAGDITPDELAKALDKLFKDLPANAKLKPVADVPEPKGNLSILVRREGTQTNVLFAMPGPKRDDPDYYAAEVANYILGGGGFASRLMQELRDKEGLTYGISMGLMPMQHAGLMMGQSAIDNPKIAVALGIIKDTMRRFRSEGPSEREIEAARDYLTGSMPLALTSTNKIASLLVEMQREKLGRDYLDRYGQIIRSVTARDIERVLDKYFNPDKMTMVLVGNPDKVVVDMTKETVKQ